MPTVIRIMALQVSSPGAARGTRRSSSLVVPVPNWMVVSLMVALECMKEAKYRTVSGEMIVVFVLESG